jgi:aminoglycoside phosphotransferase (APT) family kinase protein
VTHGDLHPHAILHTLGLTEATAITPVHGGSDTAIWQVEQAGAVYALRVFGEGEHSDCEREQLVMQAALVAGLPVPQVHAAGTWHDHPALLLSWLPGWPVAEELRVHPWRAWKLGVVFGRMHATIHALPAPRVFHDHLDAWIDWLGPDERSLQQCLRTMDHRSDALLHLDYHPWNVLTDGKRITGVLDWRNARAGDPRADTARTVAILRIDYRGKRPIRESIGRRVFEQGWRSGYEQKGASLRDLPLFYAWAGAVMEQDLAPKRAPEDLARIHQWTMRWKERAGCPQVEKDVSV